MLLFVTVLLEQSIELDEGFVSVMSSLPVPTAVVTYSKVSSGLITALFFFCPNTIQMSL
jgi:hypothetical protein